MGLERPEEGGCISFKDEQEAGEMTVNGGF